MYHITLSNGTIIKATSDHPFFIGGRWLRVHELKAGDVTALYNGESLAIASIEIVAQRATVYNFEVADFHTYYVSEQNVLVHNSGPCPFNNKVEKISPDKIQSSPNKRGNAPKGNDGKPVELHHVEQTKGKMKEMTRTDHRGKGNYKENHSNTGQSKSKINRTQENAKQKKYWKNEWDKGRFD